MAQQPALICVKRNNRGAAKRIANKAMSRHESTMALAIVSSVCVVMRVRTSYQKREWRLARLRIFDLDPSSQRPRLAVGISSAHATVKIPLIRAAPLSPTSHCAKACANGCSNTCTSTSISRYCATDGAAGGAARCATQWSRRGRTRTCSLASIR